MPTIQCRCRECNHRFPYLAFKGDAVVPVCPRCRGKNVEQRRSEEGFMAEPGMGMHLAGVPKGPS